MRWFTLTLLAVCTFSVSQAHHPDWENQRIWPRINLIPPLGNNLPMSYRRRFNRPTKIGGWIAYKIAPSSQEAMAWHDATHARAYKDHRPRLEKHFFYPKPWEGLKIGPRISKSGETAAGPEGPAVIDDLTEALRADDDILSTSDDLPDASELIEQERFEQRQGQTLEPVVVEPLTPEPPVPNPPSTNPPVAEPLNQP